jgi:PhnO protein
MGVTVRLAEPRDCASMAELIGQLGYGVSPEEVAVRLEAVHDEGRPVFVAERDDAIAGCLTTSVMRVLHRPTPVGRIAMLVVREGVRGQGIGSALVRAAETALAAQGCGLMEVTSNFKLTEAHRFYEQLGYQRTSVRLARDLAVRR